MMAASGHRQTPFDVAVVIATVLRPSLSRAVRSVFAQDLKGRIQIVIGIDRRQGVDDQLETLARECPSHMCLTIIDPGYSTARRNGGLYPNDFGGALRTLLSYAANSKYLAYLDDDDWWAHNHLSALLPAVAGKAWAFSYRWLVDQATAWPICPDEWDSLGPGRGINQERFGGFVSPSNLLLDKEACHFVLPYWSLAPDDRQVFEVLRQRHAWAASGKYSCYYELRPDVQRHPHHAREFAARNIGWIYERGQIETITRLAEAAATALAGGAIEDAITAGRQALALNPYHAPTLRCLALAQQQAGNPLEARAHLAAALAVDDRGPP
jgi:tetratricopeptide (TPR) repeat protein